MKILREKQTNYQWFFFYFIILICLNLIKSENVNDKSSLMAKMSKNLRDYFYVQRLYPGTDPLDNMIESEFESKKRFLEVNDKVIFIAKSLQTVGEIEDSINIADIFDSKNDRISTAKCCNRVTYEEFPAGNSIKTIIPAIKTTVKGKKLLERAKSRKKGMTCITKSTSKKISTSGSAASPINTPSPSKKVAKSAVMNSEKKQANFCVLVFAPNEARWRICSSDKSTIKKLHLKIVYSVIKLKSNKNQKILEKLVENPRALSSPSIGNWTWDKQDQWSGMCKSGIMQSPINYSTASVKKPKGNFNMSMKLTRTHTLIKKNFGEIIVVLLNFGGILKLEVEKKFVLYTPQYISFRFPGETIIDGKRSMGDMQMHFAELGKNRRVATTNGLILNVPLKPKNGVTSIKEFDQLNLEFWRHEVLKKGVYTPKKFNKKQLSIFSLDGLSKRIINNNSEYMVNMGSETIPPCKENVVHITLDKPLEIPHCQFKLLREGSLIKSRAKEIHSRLQMPLNDRPVYNFNNKKISYLPTLEGLVPNSYRKYFINKGYKMKLKKKVSKGKKLNGKKAKFAKWKKTAKKSFKNKRGFGPGFKGGKVKPEAKNICYVSKK